MLGKKSLNLSTRRIFDFKRVLNNDSQDPNENFFNAFNFKDLVILLPKCYCSRVVQKILLNTIAHILNNMTQI